MENLEYCLITKTSHEENNWKYYVAMLFETFKYLDLEWNLRRQSC